MLGKYGLDGTTVPLYNMKTSDPNAKYDHAYCSGFLPLKLLEENTGKIIWENSWPSFQADSINHLESDL